MTLSLTINGQITHAAAGATLFEYAEQAGLQVPTSCHKQGKCKECVVEIVAGMEHLSPPAPAEAHLKGSFRLSCQARVTGDSGEIRCHTMRRGNMRIERRARGLPASHQRMPLNPAVTRDGRRVLLDGQPIDERDGPIHGIAMDLGTTTVVLRLLNLETGELVADASFENPQRFGGSDVMSRIHFDTLNGGKLLMRTLAGYLARAIQSFPVDPMSIYEMVVVGNSTMRDIFFRQSVYSIGQNPYQSITEIEMAEGKRTSTSLVDNPRRCLLPINPKGRVYGAPIISGHVGADAAACMLAINIAHEDRLVAIMDIGTNTELVLGNRHRILAASCPAGPAFEGGAISCGMPALDGAIEDVRIIDDPSRDREGATFQLGVIGQAPDSSPSCAPRHDPSHDPIRDREGATVPQGICGSGLVDLLSELLRTGRMNAMGRFTDDSHRITLDARHDIHFLESDINELAQAKGANVAGLQVVFQTFGIPFDALDCFYLAGGFGRHLKAAASRRIGLIPNISDEKIIQIGNAAIEGACIALLSKTKRAELEALVRRVEHCRLETHPSFFDFFVEGCQFKPVESAAQVTP
jgi:uncharacterized 2Fe-2S/4Fe-4S cluster protein (DUF4445 family)